MGFIHLDQTSLQLDQIIQIEYKSDRAVITVSNGELYDAALSQVATVITGFIRFGAIALNPSKIVSIDWHEGYANIIDCRGFLFEVKGDDYPLVMLQTGKVVECPSVPLVETVEAVEIDSSEPDTTIIVNVNECEIEELEDLPQIGKARAKKIVENRPYQAIADLEKVLPGVDWEEIEDYIRF